MSAWTMAMTKMFKTMSVRMMASNSSVVTKSKMKRLNAILGRR